VKRRRGRKRAVGTRRPMMIPDRPGQRWRTDRDANYGDDLLPLVAEPVQVKGALKQRGDIFFLDAPVSDIIRI